MKRYLIEKTERAHTKMSPYLTICILIALTLSNQVMAMISKQYAGPTRSQIIEHCKRGNLTYFEHHFFNNPQFKINEPVDDLAKGGWHLIHIVSHCGHGWIIEHALRHGADPNARTLERAVTPLYLAALRGYEKACRILMRPRYFSKKLGFWTADRREVGLGRSFGLKWWDPVSERPGADVNLRDIIHTSPIHAAVMSANGHLINLLLDSGADINDRDSSGDTPLHLAVAKVHPLLVKLLILRGADLNAMNLSGETPMMVLRRTFEDEYERTYFNEDQPDAARISRQSFKQVIALLDRTLEYNKPEGGHVSVKYGKMKAGEYVPRPDDLEEDELDDPMLKDYFATTKGIYPRQHYIDLRQYVTAEPDCYDSIANARHSMIDNQDRIFSKKFYLGPASTKESERVPDLTAHVFGVFDGHASRIVADYLAATLPVKLESTFRKSKYAYIGSSIAEKATDYTSIDEDAKHLVSVRLDKKTSTLIKEAIRVVVEELDLEVCQLPGSYGVGSTASFVLKIQNTAFVVNIGDSRTIVLQDDSTLFSTNEHKPANPQERKHIEKAGGFIGYQNRLNGILDVSRAFGNCMFKSSRDNALKMTDKCELYEPHHGILRVTPDINVIHLNMAEHGYAFICATDGLLFNKQASDYIVSQFSQFADEPRICEDMIDYARRQRSRDDISVIFVAYPYLYKNRGGKPDEVSGVKKKTPRRVTYKKRK